MAPATVSSIPEQPVLPMLHRPTYLKGVRWGEERAFFAKSCCWTTDCSIGFAESVAGSILHSLKNCKIVIETNFARKMHRYYAQVLRKVRNKMVSYTLEKW